jgi:hypothetical protein
LAHQTSQALSRIDGITISRSIIDPAIRLTNDSTTVININLPLQTAFVAFPSIHNALHPFLPLSTSTLVEVYTSLSPPTKFSNMAPREEDLMDEDPPSINPYEVLGLEKTASADEVKSSYRKAALKHHPGMKVTQS